MGNGMGRLAKIGRAAVASLGASCAGGGGGGPPAPSGPSYDLAAGIASLSATPVDSAMDISGTSDGYDLTGTARLTQTVATATTFGGGAALLQTTTVSGTGVDALGSQISFLYSFAQYGSSAHAVLGVDTNYNSVLEYAVAKSPIEFPTSVRVGDAGFLGKMTLFFDGDRSTDIIEVSYAVIGDPNRSDAVIVEVIEQYDDNGADGQTNQFDYALTAAGTMFLQSLAVSYPPSNVSAASTLVFTVR